MSHHMLLWKLTFASKCHPKHNEYVWKKCSIKMWRDACIWCIVLAELGCHLHWWWWCCCLYDVCLSVHMVKYRSQACWLVKDMMILLLLVDICCIVGWMIVVIRYTSMITLCLVQVVDPLIHIAIWRRPLHKYLMMKMMHSPSSINLIKEPI